jgi:hypothetical protein
MKTICFAFLLQIFWAQSYVYIDPNTIKFSFYECSGAQRPYFAFLTFECSHYNGSYITASCNQTHLITKVHSDINCQNYTQTEVYRILILLILNLGRGNCVECGKSPFSYADDGRYLTIRNYGLDSTCNISNIKSFIEYERDQCYIEGDDSVKFSSIQHFFTRAPYSYFYWRYKNNHKCEGSDVETISELNDICIKTKRGYLEIGMAVSSLNFNFFFTFLILLGILI